MKLRYLFFIFLFPLLFGCSKSRQNRIKIPPLETFTIDSKVLAETRVINVWLPNEYADGANSLPVIYMVDGGIKGNLRYVTNALSKAINTKQIPPFIFVGIENTEPEKDLSGIVPNDGGSTKFREFMETELFPEIKKRYRISDKKGILGESTGGLFVMQTFFLKPEMFDYYIAFAQPCRGTTMI